MSTTTDLLDQFKATKNIASDADAARALRLTTAAISNYRQGIRHAKPETTKAMALAIGDAPEKWILRVEADRATSEESRRVWREMALQFGRAALLCLAVYTAICPNVTSANGGQNAALHKSTLYTLHTYLVCAHSRDITIICSASGGRFRACTV